MLLFQAATKVGPRFQTLFAASLIEEPERRQTDRQILLSDRLGDFVHQFQDESATLFRRTAVLVGPLVDVGTQELLGEVSVSGVDFHSIEPNVHGSFRHIAKILNRLFDMGHRQFDGRVLSIRNPFARSDRRVRVHLVRRVPGRSRGRHGGRPGHLWYRRTPRVPDLANENAPFLVHGLNHPPPTVDLLWQPESGDTRHPIALEQNTGLAVSSTS